MAWRTSDKSASSTGVRAIEVSVVDSAGTVELGGGDALAAIAGVWSDGAVTIDSAAAAVLADKGTDCEGGDDDDDDEGDIDEVDPEVAPIPVRAPTATAADGGGDEEEDDTGEVIAADDCFCRVLTSSYRLIAVTAPLRWSVQPSLLGLPLLLDFADEDGDVFDFDKGVEAGGGDARDEDHDE